MPKLYRKRLIPPECIELNNDKIMEITNNRILTVWNTLHYKAEFSHGVSYYCLDKGWKISKFFRNDNTLAYIYCDIIDVEYITDKDSYIFTDLLADVIIENNGNIKVIDLDELSQAFNNNMISKELLVNALYRLNELLSIIYNGEIADYIKILSRFDNAL